MLVCWGLQFAFIAFLMGQSLEAFIQWKAILQLALGCISAIETHAEFFVALLQTLHAQLALGLPADAPSTEGSEGTHAVMGPMLMEGLVESSFLRPLLHSFCEGMDATDMLDVRLLVRGGCQNILLCRAGYVHLAVSNS